MPLSIFTALDMTHDSSLRKMTGYGLDGRGSILSRNIGYLLPLHLGLLWDPHMLLLNGHVSGDN
jgi:hypothetical protein